MDTEHVQHASPKDFQQKSKFWGFFSKKGGLGGSKNEYFEKIFPKLKMASKIGYKTCATLPKKRRKDFTLIRLSAHPLVRLSACPLIYSNPL